MTIREAIQELNKRKFSLEYGFNNYHWTLTIFDDELEIKKEISGLFLKNVLKSYLGIELENFKEFYEIEENYIGIVFNFFNGDDESENFYKIDIDDDYGNSIKIKDFSNLVEVLENMKNLVGIEEMNELDHKEFKKDPYGYYGLSVNDFIERREF